MRRDRTVFGVGLVLLVLVFLAPAQARGVDRTSRDEALVTGQRAAFGVVSMRNDVERLQKAADWDKKVKALGQPRASCGAAIASACVIDDAALARRLLETNLRLAGRGPPSSG